MRADCPNWLAGWLAGPLARPHHGLGICCGSFGVLARRFVIVRRVLNFSYARGYSNEAAIRLAQGSCFGTHKAKRSAFLGWAVSVCVFVCMCVGDIDSWNKMQKPVLSISIHNCQSWRNVCTRLTFMSAMTAMGIKQAASPRPPTGQINRQQQHRVLPQRQQQQQSASKVLQ